MVTYGDYIRKCVFLRKKVNECIPVEVEELLTPEQKYGSLCPV